MRNMVPPATPFPSVYSTGAVEVETEAEAAGLALGEADALAVAEERIDCVAVAAVELTFWGVFSRPPSYRTAPRSTQAAAPRPTAMRIAVSGFRGGVAATPSPSSPIRGAGS